MELKQNRRKGIKERGREGGREGGVTVLLLLEMAITMAVDDFRLYT